MRGACLFTCLFLSALGVPGTAQVRDRLTFDAASVKPNRTSDQAFLNLYRPGGHVLITNHTVRMLLANAFSMDLNRAGRQLVDLPSWADSDKLALHHEMRPQPVFVVALVNSGKLGPQLRAHTDDASCDQKASTGSAGVGTTAAMPPEQAVWAAVQQLPCGRLGGGLLQERREQAWAATGRSRPSSDNPCGLSRQDRMAAITRIDITSVRRVPNIRQEVEAQQPRAIRLRLGAVGHSSRSQEIAAFSASTAIADALQNAANHSLIG